MKLFVLTITGHCALEVRIVRALDRETVEETAKRVTSALSIFDDFKIEELSVTGEPGELYSRCYIE